MRGPAERRRRDEGGERASLLAQLEGLLEVPMQLLGLAWLALLIVELTRGLSPFLAALSTAIWVAFILDFLLRLALAPDRWRYLRRNWLVVLSLAVPALRAVRVLRVARAVRGLRLVRVVSSINRGMKSLGRSMGRRGFGYVVALSLLVALAGAAGMFAFEREAAGGPGFADYGAALWWTAMLLTTMGSEYWPQTAEGRVLCFLLALYAFAVFGYVTASLATYFVGRDAEATDGELASARAVEALRSEIAALAAEVRALRTAGEPER